METFNDVGLKDRSMVWNTDLVEVRAEALSHQQPGAADLLIGDSTGL